MPDPVVFTAHAQHQAERRRLEIDDVLAVVQNPQQIVPVLEFRQSLVQDGRALIRALVEVTEDELVVVTMYRTTKVGKYWRPEAR